MDSAPCVFSPSAPPLSGGCRVLSLAADGDAPGLTLWLSAPEGEPPAEGWPLLIVLEGEAYFTAAAECARRLARRPQKTRVGPMMVMGVALAPSAERVGAFAFTPGPDTGDGAPAPRGPGLLRRLVDDVLPLAVRQGAAPARVALMGHSMSGQFVLEARARSAPFARFAAVSPSIWWNPAVIEAQPSQAHSELFLAVGAEEEAPGLPGPHLARRMVSNLRDLAGATGAPLSVLTDEDHGSTPFASLPAILRFVARSQA
ncbi:alpha/beta hydrolase [Brevundimonas guildfordensis]|uniref:Alpha/beta hydrolase n=1 Tax=Brevundimonas guildfordensis TaxID=2762241 RepID=A0ABR8R1G3_9CAUL|nr:alpha/beta hydrolase [Brevundimonas guildfordensis]MBD7941613.1 alpha/beta hydrolase [Brevundimonas guildfordensis]